MTGKKLWKIYVERRAKLKSFADRTGYKIQFNYLEITLLKKI